MKKIVIALSAILAVVSCQSLKEEWQPVFTFGENEPAEFYANLMKLLIKHSDSFEAVQVWGLNDQMSWRSKDYPLLFDGKGNPKPAFWAVADPDSVTQ